MRINNTKRKIAVIAAAILTTIFAVIFAIITLASGLTLQDYGIHVSDVAPVAQILLGIFLITAISMLLNSDTRIIGIIYTITISISIILGFTSNIIVNEMFYLCFSIGIILGGILSFIALRKNRGDWIVREAKILLTLSFAFVCYLFVLLICIGYAKLVVEFIGIMEFIWIICFSILCLFVVTLIYVIAMKYTRGVNGSDIFVLGPRGSGKTYFSIALWDYLVKNYNGSITESFILNTGDSEKCSELDLQKQYAKIRFGSELLERTEYDMLLVYKLQIKKFGFIPVTWTIVDYAGEHYDKLNKHDFENAISKILEMAANKKDVPKLTEETIRADAGSIELLKVIQSHFADELKTDSNFSESVVIMTIYGNFLKAGKVMFLVNGDKLKSNQEMFKELTDEFSAYSRIVNELKQKRISKKFAVIATKADMLFKENDSLNRILLKNGCVSPVDGYASLEYVKENSSVEKEIEQEIYGELVDNNPSFIQFINQINDLSSYFIVISVDKTSNLNTKNAGLSPWGFSEVIKFGR